MVDQKQESKVRIVKGTVPAAGAGHSSFLKFKGAADEKTLKNLLEMKKSVGNIELLREKLEKLEGIKGTAVKIFDRLNAVKKEVEGNELPACLSKVTELEGDLRKFEQGLLSILEMGIKDAERKGTSNRIERLEKEKEEINTKYLETDRGIVDEYREKRGKIAGEIKICETLLKYGGKPTKGFHDEMAASGYTIAIDPYLEIADAATALPANIKKLKEKREKEGAEEASRRDKLFDGYEKKDDGITRELEGLREKLHLMVDVSDEERAVIENLRKGLEKKDFTREISFENAEGKELAAKLATIKTHLTDESIKLTRIKEQLKGANENNKRNKLLNEQKRLNDLISSNTERERKLERQIANKEKEKMLENKKIIVEKIDAAVERVVEDETVIREARARFDGRIKELEERFSALDAPSMTSTPGSAPT